MIADPCRAALLVSLFLLLLAAIFAGDARRCYRRARADRALIAEALRELRAELQVVLLERNVPREGRGQGEDDQG